MPIQLHIVLVIRPFSHCIIIDQLEMEALGEVKDEIKAKLLFRILVLAGFLSKKVTAELVGNYFLLIVDEFMPTPLGTENDFEFLIRLSIKEEHFLYYFNSSSFIVAKFL